MSGFDKNIETAIGTSAEDDHAATPTGPDRGDTKNERQGRTEKQPIQHDEGSSRKPSRRGSRSAHANHRCVLREWKELGSHTLVRSAARLHGRASP